MEASETSTAGGVPVTYHGPADGSRADSLHVAHDDGSETVLTVGQRVTVPAEIAEQLMSEHNQAAYRIERG